MALLPRALAALLPLLAAALAGCLAEPVESPEPGGIEVRGVALDPPAYLASGGSFRVSGRLANTGAEVRQVEARLLVDGLAVQPPREFTLWPGDEQGFDLFHRPAQEGLLHIGLAFSHGFDWNATLAVGAPAVRIEAFSAEPASVALGGEARVLLRLRNAGSIPASLDVHVLLNAQTLVHERDVPLAEGAALDRAYPFEALRHGSNELKVLLSNGENATTSFQVVQPDLRIKRWLPDRVECEVRVTVTFTNEGRDAAQQVRATLEILDGTGRVTDGATRDLGDLAAGAGVDANAALRLPPGCHRDDMYQLRIRAEAANAEPILLETPPRV